MNLYHYIKARVTSSLPYIGGFALFILAAYIIFLIDLGVANHVK